MKTRNDCEIACDCVKRANVVLHVGLCKEIFARKHTATHKPTSAQPLKVTTMTHIHTYTHQSPVEPLGLRRSGAKSLFVFSEFCAARFSTLGLWLCMRLLSEFPIGVLRMSIVNILRGLPCRLENLRLKFTNEPSIFVDGDLAESIKRSASDRLGDLVP